MPVLELPTFGVNDEGATIVWEVQHGSAVRAGELIAQGETTKATFEIHAEAPGYLYQLVAQGERAATGQPIALVHETAGLDDRQVRDLLPSPAPASSTVDADKRWTKKAALLAEANGITIDQVPSAGGTIRETDVLAYLESQRKRTGISPSSRTIKDTVDDVYPAARARRLLLLGGGRGAVQVLDVVQRMRDARPMGIVDDSRELAGKTVLGVPVVGTLAQVARLWEERAFDALVMCMSNAREYRRRVFEDLSERGIPFANVIDPSVSIHANVDLGEGNVIMAHCRIGSCTILGRNNFLSAFINVEHHNRIGDHCTFGPGISTSSRVTIGSYVKFGTGIFIEPGVTIGDNSIIASGAILVGSVPANSIVKTRINYSIRRLSEPRA